MLDVKPLRYFVTLAETRHFGRAAARLNLSQPPLSRQLAALEASLGVTLIERSPRSVTLTAAGERFYDDAKAILASIEQAAKNARAASVGDSGQLNIGFTMCAAYSVLPAYARAYGDAYPDVTLNLREVVSNDLASQVLSGQIDAAENSLDSYISSGQSKYAKYFCMDEHFIVPDVLVISAKTWNTLPPAQQNALRTAAKESMDFAKTRQHEVEAQLIAKARKDGITIIEHEQINVTSIEGYILKLYTKYVTNDRDLQTVMDIIQTK